jgi:hypothetical protein
MCQCDCESGLFCCCYKIAQILQRSINDLVFRAGLSAPTLPLQSQIEFCEHDIANHSKTEENIAKNNI